MSKRSYTFSLLWILLQIMRISGNRTKFSKIDPVVQVTCLTQLSLVMLTPKQGINDPSILYYPTCTRLNQCSGCCFHPALQCQPTEVVKKSFIVQKSKFIGQKKIKISEEPVVVEEHIKCKCDCIIKRRNCNSYQVYDRSNCRCKCAEVNAYEECLKETNKKWDQNACICRCKERYECTSDTYFDDESCKCITLGVEYYDDDYSDENTV